jgi:N-acyl-L-homoserine lactone synthetase
MKRHLDFIVCETAASIAAAQRVRYEVYCTEKGWVESERCAEGIEVDANDERAVHFLALDDGVPVGTARFLLGDVCTLPASEYLSLSQFAAKPGQIVEVSRLAVGRHGRSQDLQVFVGLTLRMWEWAMDHSVLVWLAVADRPLYHLLVRIGLPVITQASPVEYMGSECVPVAFDMPKTGAVLKRRSRAEPASSPSPKTPILAK